MSDTANTGQGRDPSSDDRNLAMVGHALMFASPFVFGLTALMAVVIAYVRKPEADPVACSITAIRSAISGSPSPWPWWPSSPWRPA